MAKEVPGNTIMSQMAYQQELIRQAQYIVRFEVIAERLFEKDIELTGMSVRLPRAEGDDYLFVVRAYEEGHKVVGFNSGATFAEALRGTLTRLENKSMKWKVDQYGE